MFFLARRLMRRRVFTLNINEIPNPNLQLLQTELPNAKKVGLLNHLSLAENEGIIFRQFFPIIHTFGMRFPLDIIFINRKGAVAKIYEHVMPGRIIFGPFKFISIIEVAAGTAARLKITPNSLVSLVESSGK